MASHVGKTWLNVDSCSRHEQKSITHLDVQCAKCGGKREKKYEKPKAFSICRTHRNQRGAENEDKNPLLGPSEDLH